jgi:hypothetical protein
MVFAGERSGSGDTLELDVPGWRVQFNMQPLGRSRNPHAVEETQAKAIPRRVRGEGGCPRGDRDTPSHSGRPGRQEAEIQGREAQANAEQAAGGERGLNKVYDAVGTYI